MTYSPTCELSLIYAYKCMYKIKMHQKVSILRPLGYEPNALPLRHGACKSMTGIEPATP